MEEKLDAILGNPQLMEQIRHLAQSMEGSAQPTASAASPPPSEPQDGIDPAMLAKLAGLAGKAHMDGNQKALLHALRPYLSPARVTKLEKAMRAAKLAGVASTFLQSGGLHLFGG